MASHRMDYHAGAAGLGPMGIPDREPGWSCVCGTWKFRAVPDARTATGNNFKAAHRSFNKHWESATEAEKEDQ